MSQDVTGCHNVTPVTLASWRIISLGPPTIRLYNRCTASIFRSLSQPALPAEPRGALFIRTRLAKETISSESITKHRSYETYWWKTFHHAHTKHQCSLLCLRHAVCYCTDFVPQNRKNRARDWARFKHETSEWKK